MWGWGDALGCLWGWCMGVRGVGWGIEVGRGMGREAQWLRRGTATFLPELFDKDKGGGTGGLG